MRISLFFDIPIYVSFFKTVKLSGNEESLLIDNDICLASLSSGIQSLVYIQPFIIYFHRLK
jgi:hypothetical protein